uniref:Uncharacterized protein n=2 Tax=Kalanchoe fedtschenkoi TaxID=63787 RepID=A0A7N0TG54_KALFE
MRLVVVGGRAAESSHSKGAVVVGVRTLSEGGCVGNFSREQARRTLLMRHEAEIKSNAYWLGLLAHLQSSSVPRKDISCIKDLTSLYEAATIDDVYIAYEQLKIDENSLYSIVGIAGANAGEETAASSEGELSEYPYGSVPAGRGLSTMTRPTT